MPLSRQNGSTEPRMRPLLRANRTIVPDLLPLPVAAPPCSPGLGFGSAADTAPPAPRSGTVARLRRNAPAEQWADGCSRLEKKTPAEGGVPREHHVPASTLARWVRRAKKKP